jgi:hypothetical protein
MPTQRPQTAPDTRRWTNALPTWITSHPGYGSIRPQVRRTLQAIADRCNPADAEGSLIGAFGGSSLYEEAGCSTRAFWRHLRRLEDLGFVVTIGRGGQLGGRNYGNCYGVPGFPGALDSRKARRRQQTWRMAEDGRPQLVILEPGQQVEIWPRARSSISAESDTTVVSLKARSDTTVVSLKPESGTPPFPHGSPGNDHGASRADRSRRSPRITAVTVADLRDVRRLLVLFAQAVVRGWIDGSEASRLRFVACAVHALRVGDRNPPGLFAACYRRRMLFDPISAEDEDEARRMLAKHEHGVTSRRRARKQDELVTRESDDVAFVGGWTRLCTGRGVGDDRAAWRLLRQKDESWTWERYQSALLRWRASG